MMRQQIIATHRALLSLAICNMLLLIAKIFITERLGGIYLAWNLFLASIPFYCAWFIYEYKLLLKKWQKTILFMVWLLFLPNAPYIITDLIHLLQYDGYLLWIQILIFFSFALNGLLYGLVSFIIVRSILLGKTKPIVTLVFTSIVSLACGAGVYVGRFLRWNSWSVLTHPDDLVIETYQHFTQSSTAPFAWLFVICTSVVLLAAKVAIDLSLRFKHKT